MTDWHSSLKPSRPFWEDYRAQFQQLNGATFPNARELNKLLPVDLRSDGGCVIRFVPARDLPGIQYEHHIYTTGEVSTRENNWHDLFNALAWCRFPRLKVAMNARHFREKNSASGHSRGKKRDALTLLDESGAIVISSNRDILEALARHDWPSVFQSGVFQNNTMQVFLCGHALLEKLLQPYKAITAQALLVLADEKMTARPRETQLTAFDQVMAAQLFDERFFDAPACLSPLPLMGIPGWWPDAAQDDQFYADQTVFRPLRQKSPKAPIYDALL